MWESNALTPLPRTVFLKAASGNLPRRTCSFLPDPVARITGIPLVGARKALSCARSAPQFLHFVRLEPCLLLFPCLCRRPLAAPKGFPRLSVEIDSSAWTSAGSAFPSLFALGRPLVWPKPRLCLSSGSRRFDRLVFVHPWLPLVWPKPRLCLPWVPADLVGSASVRPWSALIWPKPRLCSPRVPFDSAVALPLFALGPLWSGRSLAFARLGFPSTRHDASSLLARGV
jgi:hypothetical protein